MTAARAPQHVVEVACVLAREPGLVVVLTDAGPVRASYGAGLLADLARDRGLVPAPGEWVTVRHWSDGPVTVEAVHGHRAPRLAPVVPLRRD